MGRFDCLDQIWISKDSIHRWREWVGMYMYMLMYRIRWLDEWCIYIYLFSYNSYALSLSLSLLLSLFIFVLSSISHINSLFQYIYLSIYLYSCIHLLYLSIYIISISPYSMHSSIYLPLFLFICHSSYTIHFNCHISVLFIIKWRTLIYIFYSLFSQHYPRYFKVPTTTTSTITMKMILMVVVLVMVVVYWNALNSYLVWYICMYIYA